MRPHLAALAFAAFLSGCYSLTPLGPNEPLPPESTIHVHLRDGSHIQSEGDSCKRGRDGYDVVGKRLADGYRPFDSTLADAIIGDMRVSNHPPASVGSLMPERGSVTFVLHDGRDVIASADECRRITDGYEVHGQISLRTPLGPFAGHIADSTIQHITVRRFNTLKTVLAVGVPVVVVTAATILFLNNTKLGPSGIAGEFKIF